MWMRFRKKFIGDREFYKRVLLIAIPMIVQNLVTSFVSFLDNIMVGQIGTEQMSGVAIVNQLLFVFNLCILVRFQAPVFLERSFSAKVTIKVKGMRSDSRFIPVRQ